MLSDSLIPPEALLLFLARLHSRPEYWLYEYWLGGSTPAAQALQCPTKDDPMREKGSRAGETWNVAQGGEARSWFAKIASQHGFS